MGIILGLGAAVCWGVGDFWATRLSRTFGALRGLLLTQGMGFALLLVTLFLTGTSLPSALPLELAMLGLLQWCGVVCLYRAFEIGALSLVSPLASGYVVITAVLAYFSGERVGGQIWCGAALLLIGITLVTSAPAQPVTTSPHADDSSIAAKRQTNRKGLPEAGFASLCFGVVFWRISYISQSLGELPVMLCLRGVAIPLTLAVLFFFPKFLPTPNTTASETLAEPNDEVAIGEAAKRPTFLSYGLLIFASGLGEVLAWLCFIYGTRYGYITVVTALSSLFSGITVVLAWLFLGERLRLVQWVGVAVVLAGVLLVST
jgi:drug/metabolite transporter (DMT)-like permease